MSAIIHFSPKCPSNQLFGMTKSVPDHLQMPKPVMFLPKIREKINMSGRAVFSTPIFVPNDQFHQCSRIS